MAALRRRDSAAAKLKDSVRQLRRYLDGDNCIERILTQKMDNVDLAIKYSYEKIPIIRLSIKAGYTVPQSLTVGQGQ